MALTASKTETWTIAMARTAGGVPGSVEAITAARVLASVTTSAWTYGAVARITAVSSPLHIRVRGLSMGVSFRGSDEGSAIDVQSESETPGEDRLGLL